MRRMTSLPGERFNLADRGVLRSGAYADIVVFDPATVADRSTYENPKQPAAGIDLVLVNGRAVWADGQHTGARPGRVCAAPKMEGFDEPVASCRAGHAPVGSRDARAADDLDAFERNLTRLVVALQGTGVRLRPHAKTHKCPVIALRQMAAGAVGVCCQTVAEAEAMVDGGVRDVLVSNEVVGRRKLARLAALADRPTSSVCVDHRRTWRR